MRWQGETYDMAEVASVDGEEGCTTVTLRFKDGTDATLTSYPGEGLYQRCTAYLCAAREEADHPHPIREAVDAVFDAAERGDIPPLTFDGGE